MFRVKICGVTNIEDATVVADAGADAIGLNFYGKSLRCISPAAAARIDAEIRPEVKRVGVFVNAELAAIRAAANECPSLRQLQLHGDETPDMIEPLAAEFAVIRVRRFDQHTRLIDLQDDLLHYASVVGRPPEAYLIDAASPDAYGGTGGRAPWESLRDYAQFIGAVPLILAGGLTPENVATAIRVVRPHGVDVASGVETFPGKKDAAKVHAFVAAAQAAFAAL